MVPVDLPYSGRYRLRHEGGSKRVRSPQFDFGRICDREPTRFSLKFQRIVQDEAGDNFISKLHRGNIAIIPWPVIESTRFYELFSSLKTCLDKQPVTHKSAGEFLTVLKMLMAKLKV